MTKIELMKVLSEEILNDRTSLNNIKENTNLIGEGLLDSIGIIRLISYIEKKLGICLKEKDLIISNFQSIDKIYCLIQKNK